MPGLPAETQCLDEPSAFAEFTLFTKLERIFDARSEIQERCTRRRRAAPRRAVDLCSSTGRDETDNWLESKEGGRSHLGGEKTLAPLSFGAIGV